LPPEVVERVVVPVVRESEVEIRRVRDLPMLEVTGELGRLLALVVDERYRSEA
jgi:hypothetical protein